MRVGGLTNPMHDLAKEIDWLAGHGFDLVDLVMEAPGAAVEQVDWPAMGAQCRDRGVAPICHAAAYLPVESPSPLVRQAALDELRRSVDAAQAAGAAICTLRFRGWPSHMPEAAGYEYCRQLYGIVVKHGQERGVQVALENRAENAHQLKYFREIFHRVPDLKLLLNIGHGNVGTAQSMTRDYLFALADRLVHVHISDNNGARDDRLPFGAPGSGGINLLRELQTLRSFQYDAGISLDMAGDRRWQVTCAEILRAAWVQAA